MKEYIAGGLKDFTRAAYVSLTDIICREAELAARKSLRGLNVKMNEAGKGAGFIREMEFTLLPRKGVLGNVYRAYSGIFKSGSAIKLYKPELIHPNRIKDISKEDKAGGLSLLPLAVKQAGIRINEIIKSYGGEDERI